MIFIVFFRLERDRPYIPHIYLVHNPHDRYKTSEIRKVEPVHPSCTIYIAGWTILPNDQSAMVPDNCDISSCSGWSKMTKGGRISGGKPGKNTSLTILNRTFLVQPSCEKTIESALQYNVFSTVLYRLRVSWDYYSAEGYFIRIYYKGKTCDVIISKFQGVHSHPLHPLLTPMNRMMYACQNAKDKTENPSHINVST